MTLRPTESWTTQQLAEFLAAVTAFNDGHSAVRGGVERAAEALDAEVAALVNGGGVVESIGFPAGDAPEEELVAAAAHDLIELELPVVGSCEVMTAELGEDHGGTLLVARAGGISYSQEEADLLRGMGRVLALALQGIDLIGELRERQTLLERLTLLQRSIASRADLEDVFDAIVTGASELLGDEVVDLSLVDPDDPKTIDVVASVGFSDQLLEQVRRTSVDDGIAGRAIIEQRPIVVEDYGADPRRMDRMAEYGMRSAMSAPVYQRGDLVGALTIGTRNEGRTYSSMERDALLAFAEHAGLALNDAKAAEETQHQAFHDPLTGLPNRALFLDRLRLAGARADRNHNSVAVLFGDLDGFKTVNDSLGHEAGDQLLIAVGQRLEAAMRPADTVARFGGDEFAILMEEVEDPIDAARAAQRMLDALDSPIEVGGREFLVTASIGIAVGRDEPEELLRNSDLAMYEAKGRGKGRYELFQADMHRAMGERLELEQDLRRAVDAGQLVLHYQPLVELETGAITGVEALLRWMHPERGMIPPNDFIPLAEETGQIHAIGRWVLHEACAQAVEWHAEHGPFQLSVNLSSMQLRQASLVREVEDALSRSGMDPGLLTLEITETVLMDATASNVERLAALKRLGTRLAVDDFGTGYSSLQYLRRFPIDWLKIAKPFVDGVDRSSEEAGLAQAIIDLAASLHLGVVAEGIESSRQSAKLIELGCSHGQGFFFSPPLPAEEIATALDIVR
jgi:diguanylate cyclase (GGDEF)-like protein